MRFIFGLFLLCFSTVALAHGGGRSYEVLSSSPSELVIRIAPNYVFDTVRSENVSSYVSRKDLRVRFEGGEYIGDPMAHGEMKLSLPLMLPSHSEPVVEVLSEKYTTITGIKLAPVPTIEKEDGIFLARYYYSSSASELLPSRQQCTFKFAYEGAVRNAHTGSIEVYPVQYDGSTIRLVKEITLRIRFSSTSITTTIQPGLAEREFYRATFINGTVADFYRSAVAEITSAIRKPSLGMKQSVQAGEEKWIAIKTTDEGIYRITAEQLLQYGISNPDPSTIALYGFGAKMLPEAVESASGELAEVAIDVRTSGGTFSELRFYAPGVHDWRYSPESIPSRINGKYWQIYHITNPYSSSGHFMLRLGGDEAQKRVVDNVDEVSGQVIARDKVPVVVLHESELNFEFPNHSREFVGESITKGVTFNLNLPPLPGYTGDATYIRPATNSRTNIPSNIAFSVNGTHIGKGWGDSLPDYKDQPFYSMRNWDSIYQVPASFGTPSTLTIDIASDDKQPQHWLNFVELFYERQTSLASGAMTFFLMNDTVSYRLDISDAAGAELWDISDARSPFRLARSSGASVMADVNGPGQSMRRFIAFREADLRTPELSATGAPVLRNTVCQTGAEMIVIVPEAYKEQGERLAEQRRRGGQATGPISVAVITVEDIYKEFGYGAKDLTAIRDFLSYTLRHTTANSKTVPSFVSLFGQGHADYQNRKTQMPLHIPAYETNHFGSLSTYRKEHPASIPDDAFFARLLPRANYKILDIAPGRITVRDANEAKVFVDKTIRYETASDFGAWRGRSVFIADDQYWEYGLASKDPLPHINDSENEINGVDPRMTVEKMYGVAYPTNISSSGALFKPSMEAAIVDAFNTGVALISFVGHANPKVWGHESFLKVPSTINKLTNLNKLPYLTTATCDFTTFDNFDELSGGVMLLTKPDGGVIGSLGTSRKVTGGEPLVREFYRTLFDVECETGFATTPVGIAYIAGRKVEQNEGKFFLLGDPSQRLLIPRQRVVVDSINGAPYTESQTKPNILQALSQVTVSGFIASGCNDLDASFNGTTTITLRDAPTRITQITTFTNPKVDPVTDQWSIEGPILYRGIATVTNGRFRATFIVPKDIKFDTLDAKIQMLAYSDDFKSALGAATNIQVFGTSSVAIEDTDGPQLKLYIGNRRFTSGEVVPAHSKIIVDVEDMSGLNTSTSSIGHSFAGWINDETSNLIDLSEAYVSRQDDYRSGTAEQQATLPLGRNVFTVRAFDALNNRTEATVEFIARDGDTYELFDVSLSANPVRSGTVFSFLQPSSPQNPVDVTIDIFTSDGRKVRGLEAKGVTVNDVKVSWDVRDDFGTLVPDGAYTYRILIEDRLTAQVAMAGGVCIVLK